MADTYDVIVIGSGPGGYVAAIRASQLGLKVALVEREHLGGICLNWGCIPTKALLRSAEVFNLVNHANDFGLTSAGTAGVNSEKLFGRSRSVSRQLNGGVGFLLKKNKVDIIWGEATLTQAPTPERAIPGSVTVSSPSKEPMQPQTPPPAGTLSEGVYQARHIIIATGARPRPVPGVTPDKNRIWTYFEAMNPPEIPKSLIVVGSGAIGIEFASFYRTIGAEVTVLELLPRILPAEDEEISRAAHKAFERHGIRIMTQTRIEALSVTEAGITADVICKDNEQETLSSERLILAAGVTANIEGIGLETVGVDIADGVIVTDDHGRTNIPGIWAIGDVTGAPMLAHKAEHQGVACVETIKGLRTHPISPSQIPACTYCEPPIASIGLTEEKAREQGREIRVGRFAFRGNGKAVALGAGDGLIKTIYDASSGKLIGAHLIGAEVTELIQGLVIAMQLGATDADLISTVFPHPTLSEMIHESALNAQRRAIHM